MEARPAIVYARETSVDVADFRRVLIESGLGAIRPVDDSARLAAMLAGAPLILTARLEQADQKLIGVARCITDFAWCCYLSDLAVCIAQKGYGVGTGLLNEARRHLGPGVSLFLVSVPDAVGFYERAGMERTPNTFRFRRER